MSDRAQFRRASLAQLMHEQDLEAAWAKYKFLGGDQLLVSNGYNQLPGGIYKRLEVATHLSDELRRAQEWLRLGRQPLTDRGIQYYVVFEGMLKDLQRKFELSVLKNAMSLLRFKKKSGPDNFSISKCKFVKSIDAPLQEVAGRTLQSANDIDTIRGFVKLLFTKLDFIEVAFENTGSYTARMFLGDGQFVNDEHVGNLKQRLNKVVPFRQPRIGPAVSAKAFRLCCEATVGSAEERHKSMDQLIKLGNGAELCPAFVVLIILYYEMLYLPLRYFVPFFHARYFDTCGITRLARTKALESLASNQKRF